MKILRRRVWNNGYGCSCCARDWEDTDWIDPEEMIPFEDLFDHIDKNRESMSDSHLIRDQYEKDGEILYGFSSRYYRVGEDTYIHWGEHRSWLYKSSIHPEQCKSKEEIIAAVKEMQDEHRTQHSGVE